MVSTRNHPSNFPPPTPSKAQSAKEQTASSNPAMKTNTRGWVHKPSNLTLIWIMISVPLVMWDCGYVFLRPHTMPGGFLERPIWTPYTLYGTVDYMYGWPAWNRNDGFPAAQGVLNVVESAFYVWYLWIAYAYGKPSHQKGRGAPAPDKLGWFGEGRVVAGRQAGLAPLVGHAAAVMTFSKTALYWLQEHFTGYNFIGHNSAARLFFLWIIPNGAWLVFPAYMIYVFTQEILEGLAVAAGESTAQSLSVDKDE